MVHQLSGYEYKLNICSGTAIIVTTNGSYGIKKGSWRLLVRVIQSESAPWRYCSSGAGYAWKLGQSGELAVSKVYSSSKRVAMDPAAPDARDTRSFTV